MSLDFDYSYTVKKDGVEISNYDGSKEVKVSCNSLTNLCDEFNIIYDANISEDADIFIKISTRLDNWNKNLIEGFNLKVTLLHIF